MTVPHSVDTPLPVPPTADDSSTPRAPLREDIRQVVLDRIVSGELEPGSRITESRLASELGVSRTPLREALFSLERDGFVRSDLARGFSVAPLSARELREVTPIIETLECLALRSLGAMAACNLADLRALNTEFAAAAGNSKLCIELDTAWHAMLLNRCPNQRLLSLIQSLKQANLRYEHLYMMDAELVARSAAQHNAILDAIEASDMEAAIAALSANWQFSLDTLLVRIGEP